MTLHFIGSLLLVTSALCQGASYHFEYDGILEFEDIDQKFDYTYLFLVEYHNLFKSLTTNVTDKDVTSSYGSSDGAGGTKTEGSIRSSNGTDSTTDTTTQNDGDSSHEKHTTPSMFQEICTEYLLSPEVTSDDYISDVDIGLFYEYLCDLIDNEECKEKEIPFYSLSLGIQYHFVDSICPKDELSTEEHEACVDSLRAQVDQFNQFGFYHSDYDQGVVESKVAGFCTKAYKYSTAYHHGTMAPSVAPSLYVLSDYFQPVSITYEPTSSTSNHPSFTPTSSEIIPKFASSHPPSVNPSISPSYEGSSVPTSLPSKLPTKFPSSKPSLLYSPYPSVELTRGPSEHPTLVPTTIPSSIPTVHPTYKILLPSEAPTHQPTKTISTLPSLVLSHYPSSFPSPKPTISTPGPSMSPSAKPSQLFTSGPSRMSSNFPSSSKSFNPSLMSSSPPTLVKSTNPTYITLSPSSSPTLMPSEVVTKLPSMTPSLLLTTKPSARPSLKASPFPSMTKSAKPTFTTPLPSESPTAEPTKVLSALPSMMPSRLPTTMPSALLTKQVSSLPSMEAKIPSLSPSTKTLHTSVAPTKGPSKVPTSTRISLASNEPSRSSSFRPSSLPSYVVTSIPSKMPSMKPSKLPTLSPFTTPSTIPSQFLSRIPTAVPTDLPSRIPTVHPSSFPSTSPSRFLSNEPSFRPSVVPSPNPSDYPSYLPTDLPSIISSQKPSTSPTTNPSISPSTSPTLKPSSTPSDSPTLSLSMEPSISNSPSQKPSTVPSSIPSLILSNPPSEFPSLQPSFKPSLKPSISIMPSQSFSPSSTPSISQQPSPFPSVGPTISPTSAPSLLPSAVPSSYPSIEPSTSFQPSISSSPSSSPSISLEPSLSRFTFEVPYMYMIGFDNPQTRENVLDGSREDVMNAVSQLMISILQSSKEVNAIDLNQRKLQVERPLQTMDQITANHHNLSEQSCTSDFTKSTDCILVTTKIIFFLNENYSEEDVKSAVVEPLRGSMEDNSFRDGLNVEEVREVKYVQSDEIDSVPEISEIPIGTGGGLVSIIAISCTLLLLTVVILFVRRRSTTSTRDLSDEEIRNRAESELYVSVSEFKDGEEASDFNSGIDEEDQISLEDDESNIGLDNDPDISIDARGQTTRCISLKGTDNVYNLDKDPSSPDKYLSDFNLHDGISIHTSQAGDISYDPSMKDILSESEDDIESSRPLRKVDHNGNPDTSEILVSPTHQDTPKDKSTPTTEGPESQRSSVFDLFGNIVSVLGTDITENEENEEDNAENNSGTGILEKDTFSSNEELKSMQNEEFDDIAVQGDDDMRKNDDNIAHHTNKDNEKQQEDIEVTNKNSEDIHPAIPTVMYSQDEIDNSDNVSTMTSLHSQTEINANPYYVEEEDSANEILSPEEKKRRSKIRQLMSRGDWDGIQTKAISFEVGDDEESISSPTSLEQKRSSLDKRRSAKVDQDFPDLDDALFDRLDTAVHAGDWAAVARIASDLNDECSNSEESQDYSESEDQGTDNIEAK